MARRRSALATKTSRAELPLSDAPEWEVISPGVRLGYRRGRGTQARGGSWLAAARDGEGKRVQEKLGRADDLVASGAAGVLSYDEAKNAARAWAAKTLKAGPEAAAALTVNEALDRYLEAKAAEGSKSLYDARSRANLHIRPKLGPLRLGDLSVDKLRRWRDGLVSAPKRRRTGKHAAMPNTTAVDLSDPEAARRRRDTANRHLTVLKACLNWCFHNRLHDDDSAWRLVAPFKATTSSRIRFLSSPEQRRLLDVVEGDLRDLIAAALMTGCRFGELARLKVRDYDATNASVFVSESKSGKPRHIALTAGGQALFNKLAEGRPGSAHLLRRGEEAWTPASYQRGFKSAVAAAGLEDISFHELRHSFASSMIRGGAPIVIVARALGHASTVMCDRHYGHLEQNHIADVIRRTAPDLAVG